MKHPFPETRRLLWRFRFGELSLTPEQAKRMCEILFNTSPPSEQLLDAIRRYK